MPPFAAPLALGGVDGDVNVARRAAQGAAGRAARVRGARRRRSSTSARCGSAGPVVLAFLATRGARCAPRARHARPRPRRATPACSSRRSSIRGDRGELRALVRRHRWGFPVGYDRDGVLANLYGVAVCPQLTYALPGGRVDGDDDRRARPRGLDRRLAALERAARAAGWRPPARERRPTVRDGRVDPRRSRASCPGWGSLGRRGPAPGGARTPRRRPRAPAGAGRPLVGRARGDDAPRAGAAPPTARSPATSGSTPTSMRTPVEAVVVERLMHGGLRPRGPGRGRAARRRARDRRAALGARRRPRWTGRSAPRRGRAGERLGRGRLRADVPPGRLVVADAARPGRGRSSAAVADGHGPDAATRRLRVFAVPVAGRARSIHVEEAIWAVRRRRSRR